MRIAWIDNAKAIGIILVVLGHTRGIVPQLENFIYVFHMPLFFFLSGFLLKDAYLKESFRSFSWTAVKRLIVPYASFWLISYLYWLSIHYLMNEPLELGEVSSSPLYPFVGLLAGTGAQLFINPALWFFTCLTSTTFLFYWIVKIKNAWLFVVLLVVLGILGPEIHQRIAVRLPWNLELSLVALVFYGAGYILSRRQVIGAEHINKNKLLPFVVASVILLLVTYYNGKVNMNRMMFGNLFLFYIGAFSGIAFTLMLSQMIPRNSVCEWLSKNTLVIFALHLPIFSVFKGIGVVLFRLDYSFQETALSSLVYTVGVFPVCYLASSVLRNCFPWLLPQLNRRGYES